MRKQPNAGVGLATAGLSQSGEVPSFAVLVATGAWLGVLGVGVLVFWLCWTLKEKWLPVPVFLTLAVVVFFAWLRVLHYSDDNANQRRDSLIAALMKIE